MGRSKKSQSNLTVNPSSVLTVDSIDTRRGIVTFTGANIPIPSPWYPNPEDMTVEELEAYIPHHYKEAMSQLELKKSTLYKALKGL